MLILRVLIFGSHSLFLLLLYFTQGVSIATWTSIKLTFILKTLHAESGFLGLLCIPFPLVASLHSLFQNMSF